MSEPAPEPTPTPAPKPEPPAATPTPITLPDDHPLVRTLAEQKKTIKELKQQAEGKATAEEKIANLEKEVEATKREALKRRIQAAHGISDEDADLFLTGSDEQSLAAQAKRLAEREAERKKQGGRVPTEGRIPTTPGEDPMRDFTRKLFDRDD